MKKLIKFEKTGCNPCTMVQNFLDANEVEVEKVDVFANPSMAGQFDIGSVPTVILVDEDNNEVSRSIGYKPEELEELVAQLN